MDLAKRLAMKQQAVGYAVSRGGQLARKIDYRFTK